MENPFPLQILRKVNTPEMIALLAQYGRDKYADADDINSMLDALEYLYEHAGSPGGTVSVKITPKFINYSGARSNTNFAAAVNAMAPVQTAPGELLLVTASNPMANPAIVPSQYKFFILNKGGGKYGAWGSDPDKITLTGADIGVVYVAALTPADAANTAGTQTIDLLEIADTAVDVALSSRVPEITIQDMEDGYRVVNATRSGVPYQWFFTGPGGIYGDGHAPATPGMFKPFAAQYAPTLSQVLESGHREIKVVSFDDLTAYEFVPGDETKLIVFMDNVEAVVYEPAAFGATAEIKAFNLGSDIDIFSGAGRYGWQGVFKSNTSVLLTKVDNENFYTEFSEEIVVPSTPPAPTLQSVIDHGGTWTNGTVTFYVSASGIFFYSSAYQGVIDNNGFYFKNFSNNKVGRIYQNTLVLGNASSINSIIENDEATTHNQRWKIPAEGGLNAYVASRAYVDSKVVTELAQYEKAFYSNNIAGTAVTSTITETLVRSVQMPGGTFANGSYAEIMAMVYRTGTAGNCTVRIYINSTNSLSGATSIGNYTFATTRMAIPFRRRVMFDGSNMNLVLSAAVDNYTDNTFSPISVPYNVANGYWFLVSIQPFAAGDSFQDREFSIRGKK